jgi:hypothetical protein
MSIVKATANSRWKGALLAAVAAGAFAPAAAHATLTVDLSFGASNTHGGSTAYFVTPDNGGTDIPVYVYATITGTGVLTTPPATGTTTVAPVVSGGDFSGLQYLYYNIMNSGANEVAGGVDTAALNATLGFNGTGGVQPIPVGGTSSFTATTSYGSQVGSIINGTPSGATPGLSLGSTVPLSSLTTATAVTMALASIPKPRANSPVFQNYASAVTNSSAQTTYTNYGGDGQNIIINSATSVSFLVETIYYKPTSGTFTASTLSSPVETTFGAAIPALPAAVNIAESNFYQDATFENSGTSQATSTASVVPGKTATVFNAQVGDVNGDGTVNSGDLGILLAHYNNADTKWADGNFNYAGNSADTVINSGDLGELLANYNHTLVGSAPQDIGADAALLADPAAVAALEAAGFTPVAVPEPGSIALVGLVGLVGLGRRSKKVSE